MKMIKKNCIIDNYDKEVEEEELKKELKIIKKEFLVKILNLLYLF